MHRCIVKYNSFQETIGDRLVKRLVGRLGKVRIEIVENNVNGFCLSIAGQFDHASDLLGEILFCSAIGNRYFPVSTFWFHGHEDILCTVSFVLTVPPANMSFVHGVWRTHVIMQLLALFIEADDRFIRIVRRCVQVENIFHPFNEPLIDFRDAPHFFPATV